MSPVAPDSPNYKWYTPKGKYTQWGTSRKYHYILKDGSSVIVVRVIPYAQDKTIYEPKGGYSGGLGVLLYDINGRNGNNIAGKEVFAFVIDDSGLLIPFGSNAHRSLVGDGYTYSCSKKDSSDSYYDALDCTGKIADNGWKADY